MLVHELIPVGLAKRRLQKKIYAEVLKDIVVRYDKFIRYIRFKEGFL